MLATSNYMMEAMRRQTTDDDELSSAPRDELWNSGTLIIVVDRQYNECQVDDGWSCCFVAVLL